VWYKGTNQKRRETPPLAGGLLSRGRLKNRELRQSFHVNVLPILIRVRVEETRKSSEGKTQGKKHKALTPCKKKLSETEQKKFPGG